MVSPSNSEGRRQRYELTDSGRALRPVLVELARWGADRVRLSADSNDVSARVALTSLLLDPPPLPPAAAGDYEIHVGDEIARFSVRDDTLTLAPDLTATTSIELTAAGLRALLLGLGADELIANGDVCVRGDSRARGNCSTPSPNPNCSTACANATHRRRQLTGVSLAEEQNCGRSVSGSADALLWP